MIGVVFQQGTDIIEVRIDGSSVYFRVGGNEQFATIDGLKLSKGGVLKEFPDLKDNTEWKKIAIERFKEKIIELPTEEERVRYVINDLSKHGFEAKAMQKAGHRPIKLKNGK